MPKRKILSSVSHNFFTIAISTGIEKYRELKFAWKLYLIPATVTSQNRWNWASQPIRCWANHLLKKFNRKSSLCSFNLEISNTSTAYRRAKSQAAFFTLTLNIQRITTNIKWKVQWLFNWNHFFIVELKQRSLLAESNK